MVVVWLCAVLIIAGILSGVVLRIAWEARLTDRRVESPTAEQNPSPVLTQDHVKMIASRSATAVNRALSAHMSLYARLWAVGEAAREHADDLDRLHTIGLRPRSRANANWQVPAEISRDLPRPGAPKEWQALDRSFDTLLAVIDDPSSTFADQARGYRSVATSAERVCESISSASASELAAGCSFCGKRRTEVGRLIAGTDIYICDECVLLCVEILEEEGSDWRDDADRRLRGD